MIDPFTSFEEGAAQLHEMLVSYVKAGFTREEGMRMIIAILTAAIGGIKE